MQPTVIIPNPVFSKNRRTPIKQSIKDVLEHHFKKEKWPSTEELALLAESLQLEKKVLRVWFSNRRQKEKKTLSNIETTLKLPPSELEEDVSMTNEKRKLNNFQLNLSAGQYCGNVKRFSLGQPNGSMQRRTVLVLGTKEFIHKKFIAQIINYIVNTKEGDTFRLQVVEEEGQSNCISVYDIHPVDGFRIPYSLTIVVIPHSGDWEDSGQLFRDQKVAEMFREFTEAKDGIKELDMICNVTVKTDDKMKQPFLSIFGKDVEKNINNWELTADFLSDKAPWLAVIRHFFLMLAKMKPKSLLLTKWVLNERKKLEVTINRLQYVITTVLSKIKEINSTKQEIKKFQEQIEINILHYNSLLPDLFAPDVTGFFPISPGPHNQRLEHVNTDRNHLPSKEVNRMYRQAEIKWNEIELEGRILLESLHKDLLEIGLAMKKNFDQTWNCIKQINRIALHGNSFLTQRVFDLLFDAEQHLKQMCLQEKRV